VLVEVVKFGAVQELLKVLVLANFVVLGQYV